MITHWLLGRSWLPGSLQVWGWLLLYGAAAVYLNGFPGGFQPFDPLLVWLLARGWYVILGYVVFLLASVVVDRLEWQGPIKLRTGEGDGWARSIRSRLGLLLYLPFLLVISYGLFDFAQRTGFAADWGRFSVAAFFCLDLLLMALAGVWMAMSRRRILAIEMAGVRVGNDFLPFSAVQRVRVRGDLKDREVALVIDGRERWLNLRSAGVSVRTFVERLVSAAPGLQVDWPLHGEGEA